MRMTRQRYTRNLRRRRFWMLIEIICAAVCIVIFFFIGQKLWRYKNVRQEERAAKVIAETASEQTIKQPVKSISADENIPAMQQIEMLDYFKPLAEQNEDIAGLVEFGKDMALYVAQADDNYYYLTHKFDRTETPAGMIFMDCECAIEPVSDNIILYGHNMGNGSRFGLLKRFETLENIRKYPVVRFTSLYRQGNYAIIAVYHTTVDKNSEKYIDFRTVNFDTEEAFYAYLDIARNASLFEIPIDVKPEDELLTMITCSNAMENGRLVILCRKQREGENMENLNAWLAEMKKKQPIYG